jgi:D-alanine-D-alanine ligase
MPEIVCIVYNAPDSGPCTAAGEAAAVAGVLQSVESVSEALQSSGCAVATLPLQAPLSGCIETLRKLCPAMVFNLFEGFDGKAASEGAFALLLEVLRIPHTGAPARALQQCCDKHETKKRLRRERLPTADWMVLNPAACEDLSGFALSFPCFVKPVSADASHGLSQRSLVNDTDELRRQVLRLHVTYGQASIVEEFLPGREFNVFVMGPPVTVFPVSEIIYRLPKGVPPFLTYASKWDEHDPYYAATAPRCPADINSELASLIRQLAAHVFLKFVGHGYARIDMRMNNRGEVMVLEVNPNPDIGPASGASLQARQHGLRYRDFIGSIMAVSGYGAALSTAAANGGC